jgi:Na+-transporting NADH:ubiquinone oxidoreductase subunit NqrB
VPVDGETKKESKPVAATTEQNPVHEVQARKVTRIEAFAGGGMPWLTSTISMVIAVGAAILVIKHGLSLRRFVVKGEKFVLHHALLDITIIGIIGLCVILTRTAGMIR